MNEKFTEYAGLITRVGANVQQGQTVVISCPVDCAYFARLLAGQCYDAGAKEVVFRWSDDALTKMRYMRARDDVFDEVAPWFIDFYNYYAKQGAALISVYATDPDLLKDVPPDRIQRDNRTKGLALTEFRNMQMNNEFPWCIVSIPTPDWAQKVFPSETGQTAVEKLWDAIFAATLVGGGDAVKRWREKIDMMLLRAKKLTEYNFSKLIYSNKLGTNLTIELPERHKWMACGERSHTGVTFVANIPSEEIFTSPKRDGVNGVVYSSKPLSLDGKLIEDIVFTIENGKIVEATASSGLEFLLNAIDLDEGARYLGEVALVPFHSPISDMNLLFYNTLFDENASCHLAFGKAYPTFTDGEELSEQEMKERGLNDSITHEDFMIGTEDLSITGVKSSGETVPVFINGNFAF